MPRLWNAITSGTTASTLTKGNPMKIADLWCDAEFETIANQIPYSGIYFHGGKCIHLFTMWFRVNKGEWIIN